MQTGAGGGGGSGSWFMALGPARPQSAAALTCHGGVWTGLRWAAPSLPGNGETDRIGTSCSVGLGSSASRIQPEALMEHRFCSRHSPPPPHPPLGGPGNPGPVKAGTVLARTESAVWRGKPMPTEHWPQRRVHRKVVKRCEGERGEGSPKGTRPG